MADKRRDVIALVPVEVLHLELSAGVLSRQAASCGGLMEAG